MKIFKLLMIKIRKLLKKIFIWCLGEAFTKRCIQAYVIIDLQIKAFFKLYKCILLDIWITWSYKWKPNINKNYDLIIIRIDAIGDFFLWLSAALALQKEYQGQHTLLIANSIWATLAKKFANFEDILEFDRTKFELDLSYRKQFLLIASQIHAKKIISPCCSRDWELDIVVYTISAQEKIGVAGDISCLNRVIQFFTNRFYNKLIKIEPNSQMELINNAQFIREIIDKNFQASIVDIAEMLGWQKATLDYFVIFPGCSCRIKMWPLEKFAYIARHFAVQKKLKIVICGGKGEEPLALQLASLLPELSVEIQTGKTTLEELMKIIFSAQFLVSNDTSAVHIAQALGTPSFCIVGGGHFGRFIPYTVEAHPERNKLTPLFHKMPCYKCQWRCIYKHHFATTGTVFCITEINEQDVIQAIQNYFHW